MTVTIGIAGSQSDISTPMPLAGHDDEDFAGLSDAIISTPMPLAGHDGSVPGLAAAFDDFYSHAPRGA